MQSREDLGQNKRKFFSLQPRAQEICAGSQTLTPPLGRKNCDRAKRKPLEPERVWLLSVRTHWEKKKKKSAKPDVKLWNEEKRGKQSFEVIPILKKYKR